MALYVDTLEPQSGTTLTVGETGQNTVVGGNTIKLNTLKDSGGNTLFTSNGSGVLSSVNDGFGSGMALLQTQTADDSASLSFTSNIDSTYKEYVFRFYNIRPETNNTWFQFQVNASGESGYNETMTTTVFASYHAEADNWYGLSAQTGDFQSQGTGFQSLCIINTNDADGSGFGELHLYNPASTTYVKHFLGTVQYIRDTQNQPQYIVYAMTAYTGGYINTTSAITEVQFKQNSGNFNGTIKLYGVK